LILKKFSQWTEGSSCPVNTLDVLVLLSLAVTTVKRLICYAASGEWKCFDIYQR